MGYTIGRTAIGANWGSHKTETVFDPDTAAGTATDHRKLTEEKKGGGAELLLGFSSDKTDTTFSGGAVGDTDTANAGVGTKKGNKWSFGLAFGF